MLTTDGCCADSWDSCGGKMSTTGVLWAVSYAHLPLLEQALATNLRVLQS